MDAYQIGVRNDNVVSIGPSWNGNDNNSNRSNYYICIQIVYVHICAYIVLRSSTDFKVFCNVTVIIMTIGAETVQR